MTVNEQSRSGEAVENPQTILSETEATKISPDMIQKPNRSLVGLRRPRLGFQLTERERELLEFVLDQKFAGTSQLYYRFYQNGASRSPRYAWERLSLLYKHGLLRAERVYTERETYYQASGVTQRLLQGLNPNRLIQEPPESIDLRFFEHDRRITWCRAVAEKSGKVREWRSERRLKQEFAQAQPDHRIAREFMPDAIYRNHQGGQVALELELTPKTPERLAKKISQLVQAMRNPAPLFSRVLYVPCSRPIQERLENLTRPYGELFRVQFFSELVPQTVFSGGVS